MRRTGKKEDAMKNGSELNDMAAAKTGKMVFILGMMAFWCNGDNNAAAHLLVEIAKGLHLEISQAALSVTAYMLPFGLAGSPFPEATLMERRILIR
jgi:predicted MFS family arabinose efflux permease